MRDWRSDCCSSVLRTVAGLGNIYVCEALFRSGISPNREAGRISALRVEKLARAIRDVLTAAIEAGGSTLRDSAHTAGALGYFQHSFTTYGRDEIGQARCRDKEGQTVIKRLV